MESTVAVRERQGMEFFGIVQRHFRSFYAIFVGQTNGERRTRIGDIEFVSSRCIETAFHAAARIRINAERSQIADNKITAKIISQQRFVGVTDQYHIVGNAALVATGDLGDTRFDGFVGRHKAMKRASSITIFNCCSSTNPALLSNCENK